MLRSFRSRHWDRANCTVLSLTRKFRFSFAFFAFLAVKKTLFRFSDSTRQLLNKPFLDPADQCRDRFDRMSQHPAGQVT